jgi:hypothetical protein
MNSIEYNLAKDIFTETFKFLPVSDFKNIALVCKLFAEIINESQCLWQEKCKESLIWVGQNPQPFPSFRSLFQNPNTMTLSVPRSASFNIKIHLYNDDLTLKIFKELIVDYLIKRGDLKKDQRHAAEKTIMFFEAGRHLFKAQDDNKALKSWPNFNSQANSWITLVYSKKE